MYAWIVQEYRYSITIWDDGSIHGLSIVSLEYLNMGQWIHGLSRVSLEYHNMGRCIHDCPGVPLQHRNMGQRINGLLRHDVPDHNIGQRNVHRGQSTLHPTIILVCRLYTQRIKQCTVLSTINYRTPHIHATLQR